MLGPCRSSWAQAETQPPQRSRSRGSGHQRLTSLRRRPTSDQALLCALTLGASPLLYSPGARSPRETGIGPAAERDRTPDILKGDSPSNSSKDLPCCAVNPDVGDRVTDRARPRLTPSSARPPSGSVRLRRRFRLDGCRHTFYSLRTSSFPTPLLSPFVSASGSA